MKPIISLAGTAAVKVVADDVISLRGALQRDLIEFIGGRYAFNVVPPSGPGITPLQVPVMQFQSGRHLAEYQKVGIMQLSMYPDGDSVSAQDTQSALVVLNDFMDCLNQHISYRFSSDNVEYKFSSGVVAEFSEEFVSYISASSVLRLVNQKLDKAGDPTRHFRKLSFSFDPTLEVQNQLSVEATIPKDFTFERRSLSKVDSNRIFCSGPMQTEELFSLLEEMESDVVQDYRRKIVKRLK